MTYKSQDQTQWLSGYEMFTKRGSDDNHQIDMTDDEMIDRNYSKRLHGHNPPADKEQNFKKGDLVLITSDRSKTCPRHTYLLNALIQKNDCEWAELYKLGDKITNRPQLVKVQDLIRLPTSRTAKTKANLAIREMMPDIMSLAASKVPEHSWSYQQLLDLFNSGELDDDDKCSVGKDAIDLEVMALRLVLMSVPFLSDLRESRQTDR